MLSADGDGLAVNKTTFQIGNRGLERPRCRSASSLDIPILAATPFLKMMYVVVSSIKEAAFWYNNL